MLRNTKSINLLAHYKIELLVECKVKTVNILSKLYAKAFSVDEGLRKGRNDY